MVGMLAFFTRAKAQSTGGRCRTNRWIALPPGSSADFQSPHFAAKVWRR